MTKLLKLRMARYLAVGLNVLFIGAACRHLFRAESRAGMVPSPIGLTTALISTAGAGISTAGAGIEGDGDHAPDKRRWAHYPFALLPGHRPSLAPDSSTQGAADVGRGL